MTTRATEGFPAITAASASRIGALAHGCTFDDFILAPQRSIVLRRDPAAIDLSCRLSRRIMLNRPIVSANMDTVTRAPMAIVQAEEGGIGIIDRGFRSGDIEPQVREVEIVKVGTDVSWFIDGLSIATLTTGWRNPNQRLACVSWLWLSWRSGARPIGST